MYKTHFKLILATLLLSAPSLAQAHKPYQAIIELPPASSQVSATNLVDLQRDLEKSLDELSPLYTPTSAVAININLRGIETLTAFPANSTTLVVTIPQIGVTETFEGGTRDASFALYRDYVRNAGNHHHHLLNAYAKYSPIDPIAGNPTSLMDQMGLADYRLGVLSPLSGCACDWDAQPLLHQFQAGVDFERAFVDEFETTLFTNSMRYSYSPNGNWALITDVPLTFIDNGGAYSVYGSLGMALRIPIIKGWSLTPTLRQGFGGSLDLCTAGSFFSTGLTSLYHYKINNFVLGMTNYVAYITSTNLWLSGINFNYHLQNYIFKNGLSLTTCQGLTICEIPLNFSLSFTDSCYAKENLYIRHFDEFNISMIGNRINPWIDYDCLSIGFTYQFGEKNFKGYQLNIAYQF